MKNLLNQLPIVRRRPHFSKVSTVKCDFAAVFNRADENERHFYEVIQRAHAGRWPTWRALALVRVGSMLYEAAQWHPARRAPRVYSVLTWNLAELGVSWKDQPSAIAARRMLQALAREATVQAARSASCQRP